MSKPELLLAPAALAAAVLLAAEFHDWWRPLPQRGTLQRRLRPGPRRSSLRLQAAQAQAILIGLGSGLLLSLISANPLVGLIAGVIGLVVAWVQVPRWHRRRLTEKARAELQTALAHLVTSLRAGQSLGSALLDWHRSVSRALGPGKWILLPHLARLRSELQHGATPEEALGALARRLHLEELHMLTRVVRLCRQRGGDLSLVVTSAATMLAESLEVKAQLHALTAGKRAEGLVITLVPPGMFALIAISNPDYVAPLIHSGAGRIMLTVAFLLELASFAVSRWLLRGEL